MKRISILIFLLLLFSGCSKNVRVHGKVTFEDNTPLSVGCVCFETESYFARGMLQADGSYELGSLSATDGILPGTYRVYVSGATKEVGSDREGMPMTVLLIDQKFTTGATSGLTATVDASNKTFDFQVVRYTAKK